MGNRITISLDAMGGDLGVSVVVPAAIDFLRRDNSVNLILVGIEEEIRAHLATRRPVNDCGFILHHKWWVWMSYPRGTPWEKELLHACRH